MNVVHFTSLSPTPPRLPVMLFPSILPLSLLPPGRCHGGAIVTDVTPRHIGWRGGAVTIHGAGFSEDVFNQFDPVLGNKVSLCPLVPACDTHVSDMVCQRVCLCALPEPHQLQLPAGEPAGKDGQAIQLSSSLHMMFQDPSTTKIVCDLPGREGSKGSNWFKLILKVKLSFMFIF